MFTETLNWNDFLTEGNNYFNKARKWAKEGKFNNDVIYNLILMSIEKNFMALMMKNNYLPENHTLSDLVEGVNQIFSLDKTLEKKLLEIEKFQQICTIHDYARKTEDIKDIELVVQLGEEVNNLVQNKLH